MSCKAIQARGSTTYPYPSQAAWDLNPFRGYTGNGVNVAVLDSGVDDLHSALAGRFVAGYNSFTRQGGPGVNPDDDWVGWYHGTAVAGMIMANDRTQQYMGVAPQAGLIDCKIFDSSGQSQASLVIDTILWLMNNALTYNIGVANMSFGGRTDDGTDALARAANALVQFAGVVVVASAGNTPPINGICSPGSGDLVLCVGGVTDNNTVLRTDDVFTPSARTGPRQSPPPTYMLSYGDLKPNVSAYMVAITSCLGTNPGQGGGGWWQHPRNGTSWATAHTSGVAAILLEKYPGLAPGSVCQIIMTSAEGRGTPSFPWLDPVYNVQYGQGIVSAGRAVNLPLPTDVFINNWTPNNWNSHSIWAGHYPVRVGDPNTLNARVGASGNPASGVQVTFSIATTGWGAPWSPVGSTTVNVSAGGSVVATIPYTPNMEGHKCFRVVVSHPQDTRLDNNTAQENIDVQPPRGFAATSPASEERPAGGGGPQRYTFPLMMCVEPSAPFWRTADACICTKDLPFGSEAWLVPEPPFDLMPGQCQPCELIVEPPEGTDFEYGDAVYVNGWFWGNGISEGGIAIHFVSPPPIETTIREVQYTEDPTGQSPLRGQSVSLSGVATTDAGTYPSGTYPYRWALQDGNGPWSGIFVRDVGLPVARGDRFTVTGTVVETGGLTELDFLCGVELQSSGNPLPAPEVLDPGVVDASESYEGVLVQVEDVEVIDAEDPDHWQVAAAGSCWVGHWGSYTYTPLLGDSLDITAVVGSIEDLLKLQPRDDADIRSTGQGVPPEGTIEAVTLSQSAPNPSTHKTGFAYTLARKGDVQLRVFSVGGRLIRTLVDGQQPAGRWRVEWDGRDDDGRPASSGAYYYKLTAGGRSIARQMVLLR